MSQQRSKILIVTGNSHKMKKDKQQSKTNKQKTIFVRTMKDPQPLIGLSFLSQGKKDDIKK